MKYEWKVGDRFKYVGGGKEGTTEWFDSEINLGDKLEIESVHDTWVSAKGWSFYLDEIKLVVKEGYYAQHYLQ